MTYFAAIVLPIALLAGSASDGCTDNRTESDKRQDTAQEAMTAEANRQIGMPGITNFTERRIVRKLYELRDSNIATHAYVMDLEGRLWHVCESIGYGLPYGVQFTNPHRPLHPSYSQSAMADQAEPNGLFMPSTAEGTWVICASEKAKGEIAPVYVEPRVIVSPFVLKSAGDWQER